MNTPSEQPRDVFLRACVAIGGQLASIDFQPRATGQRLIRRRGEFTEEISFQSSHRNLAGEWIAMWPAAMIRLRPLKAWRNRMPDPGRRDDVLAAGRVENIASVPFGAWNLADRSARDSVIASVVDALRAKVLPWFDLLEDDAGLLDVAQQRDVPCFDVEWLTEYAVFLARPDVATEIIKAWLKRRGDTDSSGFVERLQRVVDRHHLDVQLPAPRYRANLDATAERLRKAAGGTVVIK